MESDKKNTIYQTDLQYIFQNLRDIEREKLKDSSILVTGCGGFLGYYLMSFLSEYSDKLGSEKLLELTILNSGNRNGLQT